MPYPKWEEEAERSAIIAALIVIGLAFFIPIGSVLLRLF